MTAEEKDNFPVGMRVLAVDDDPTCLRLLESLLRRCQYNVTTTNQAITALKLLRENKRMFDLVISDVHMPDMDGFKLLELVGLEMDLPVIMLSGNSDTKAVMKGITHGAVDYLTKPVRIEELRNIWQHVIRRRKTERKRPLDRNGGEKIPESDGRQELGNETDSGGSRLAKKRREQAVEEEDSDENEFDDPSTQKKPRVVWSVDLHRKFVAAVNELGIDKAVPKRILELMNVEKLTRENVASHLQKYRLYLKRIHAAAISQQSNVYANLGGKESFLTLASMEGTGGFNHTLPGIGMIQSLGKDPQATALQTGAALPSASVLLNRLPNTMASNSASGTFLGSFPDPNGLIGGSSSVFLDSPSLQPARPMTVAVPQPVATPPLQLTTSPLLPVTPPSLPELTPPPLPLLPLRKSYPPLCVDSWRDSASTLVDYPGVALHTKSLASGQFDRYGINQGSSLTLPYDGVKVPSFGYARPRGSEDSSRISVFNQGGHGNGIYAKGVDFGVVDQQLLSQPLQMPRGGSEKLCSQSGLKVKDEDSVGPAVCRNPAGNYHDAAPYDDLVNAMIKMESDDILLIDGDLSSDVYSLEACI